jgi:hypothetical protein
MTCLLAGADPEGDQWVPRIPFWATIFNCHVDFGQKVGNYHVTTQTTMKKTLLKCFAGLCTGPCAHVFETFQRVVNDSDRSWRNWTEMYMSPCF